MTWNPRAGAFGDQVVQTARRDWRGSGVAGGKAEIVLLPELFEFLQAVDENEGLRRVGAVLVAPCAVSVPPPGRS